MEDLNGLFKIRRVLMCLFILLLTSSGCGYRFGRVEKPSGAGITSVSIPIMESTSSLPGFEADFTRVVREEFISRTQAPLVSTREASAVLIGRIVDIQTEPISYDVMQTRREGHESSYEVTDSRRLVIELDAKLVDRISGDSIWVHRGMKEKARYEVTSDPLTNRYNKREAIRKIASRFAERVFLKTMERF